MSQAPGSTLQHAAELERALRSIIRGKDDVVRLALVAILARGHLLIEGVPGVGKTTLAHALARAIDCDFRRVQFTSDMLPSDVLGISVYSTVEERFEFKRGPIFTNILLADEINRTTPKTQSALLEAMNERQVTVDGHPHPLPNPFLVIATQNPVEHHGTYPLPESQLDRFLIRARMGYPEPGSEREILRGQAGAAALEDIAPGAQRRGCPCAAERSFHRAGGGFADRLLAGHCGAHAAARAALAWSLAPGIVDALSRGAGHGIPRRPELLHSRMTSRN